MANMTTPRLCLLLFTLAGSATALAGADTCSSVTGYLSAPSASDINYTTINQALLTSDPTQRLIALTAELRKLDVAHAPEAPLVRHRLLMATARTQAALGMDTAAMGNLKRLPVSSPVAPEALMFMADIEVKDGKPRAAVRWLRQLADLYLAQQLHCYSGDYLADAPTPERLLETVERYEEDLTDTARPHPPPRRRLRHRRHRPGGCIRGRQHLRGRLQPGRGTRRGRDEPRPGG